MPRSFLCARPILRSLCLLLTTAACARADSTSAVPPAATPAPQTVTPTLATRLAQAREERNVEKRLQRLVEIAASLSRAEIDGALGAADKLDELREVFVWKQAVLTRWSELAHEEAFAHIAKLPEGRLKSDALRIATANFVRKDPARAAAAAANLSAGVARNDTLTLIADLWAQADVKAALAWADKLPEGFAKESALKAIGYVWVRLDPVAATALVEKLPASSAKDDLVANVAHGWAPIDRKAALAWVDRLPASPGKESARISLAESWANQNPGDAAAYVATLPSGDVRAQAAAAVASIWAKQSPRPAVEWAWRNEDPNVRERALEAALEVWAPIDPAGAGEWIASLPAGTPRDATIVAYVNSVVMYAPDLAAGLARQIAERNARTRAIEQCLARWEEVDATAAHDLRDEYARSVATATGDPDTAPTCRSCGQVRRPGGPATETARPADSAPAQH